MKNWRKVYTRWRKSEDKRSVKDSDAAKPVFWRAIENPLYFGKIFIPGYKDEESRLAQGQHEALISENLFYDVQDLIDGKKKRQRPNVKEMSNNMFPLRGFLKCPNCHRLLTASASKGRNGRYHYYHCVASCGPRYACGRVNDQFVKELQKFKPQKGVTELFKLVVNKAFKGQTKHSQTEKKHILDQIDALNNKLGKARELLLTCDIDPKDYRTMKSEIEEKLVRLEANLTEMTTSVNSPVNLEKMLDKAVNALSNIDLVYARSDTNQKREIIGSIYPEKLVFSESGYRTIKINEAAAIIFQINSDLEQEKRGTFSDVSQKFRFVPLPERLSNHFLEDLEKIVKLLA